METLIPHEEIKITDYLGVAPITGRDLPIKEDFKPVGAMAFFILLIMLCLVVWFGIYFLMLQRN